MHTVRFKEAATLQDVISKVVDRRTADPTAMMARIQELNRHVDLEKKLKAGAVLILPDEPGIKRSDKDNEGSGMALEDIGAAITAGIDATRQRAAKALEEATAERAGLQAALKTSAAKRQMESDAGLRKQLDASAATAEARQKALKEAAGNVDLLRKSFAQELKAMEKLFR
jgi:hypothetical protein